MECRKRLKAGKCQSQEQSIVEIMSQPRRRPLEATSHICGAQQHNQEEAWPLFTPDQTYLRSKWSELVQACLKVFKLV